MRIAKRVVLFLAVNVLILLTLSINLQLLGVRPYLGARGIDYGALMSFCLVWGMGGAFISLALSRVMAKWTMGVQVIDPETRDPHLSRLVRTVHRLAQAANLPAMPEVGFYPSPEINAFATGPTKSRALVAVSAGLLEAMDDGEVEGVLAHEVSHIANGDMVTMTLIAGVVNAFAMFLSRVISYFVSLSVKEDMAYLVRIVLTIALDIFFSILGSIVVAAFSRAREFRADSGGATLAGREKMIAALESLKRNFKPVDNRGPALDTLKVAGKAGFMALFSTHPALDRRIAALRAQNA